MTTEDHLVQVIRERDEARGSASRWEAEAREFEKERNIARAIIAEVRAEVPDDASNDSLPRLADSVRAVVKQRDEARAALDDAWSAAKPHSMMTVGTALSDVIRDFIRQRDEAREELRKAVDQFPVDMVGWRTLEQKVRELRDRRDSWKSTARTLRDEVEKWQRVNASHVKARDGGEWADAQWRQVKSFLDNQPMLDSGQQEGETLAEWMIRLIEEARAQIAHESGGWRASSRKATDAWRAVPDEIAGEAGSLADAIETLVQQRDEARQNSASYRRMWDTAMKEVGELRRQLKVQGDLVVSLQAALTKAAGSESSDLLRELRNLRVLYVDTMRDFEREIPEVFRRGTPYEGARALAEAWREQTTRINRLSRELVQLSGEPWSPPTVDESGAEYQRIAQRVKREAHRAIAGYFAVRADLTERPTVDELTAFLDGLLGDYTEATVQPIEEVTEA